jgi:hypothetical protein
MKALRDAAGISLCRSAMRRHFRNRFCEFLKFAAFEHRTARHPEVRAVFGEPRMMSRGPSFEARKSAHLQR